MPVVIGAGHDVSPVVVAFVESSEACAEDDERHARSEVREAEQDVAEATYLATDRTRAIVAGPRMRHLDKRRKELAQHAVVGGGPRSTERPEPRRAWMRRLFSR